MLIYNISEVKTMKLLESGEMYLESIYVLSRTNSAVRSIDVCEYMKFSKPSVSRAIGLLRSGGYVNVDKAGHISLTQEGLSKAEKIYERHQMLTAFLTKLGVSADTADKDACKMEHVLSDETISAIKKHLDS